MVDTVSTDPFTNLYLDHAAIRRDVAVDTTEVLKEGLKEAYNTRGDVKDSRYDLLSRIGDVRESLASGIENSKDHTSDRLFAISRDVTDNRAQINALGYQVRDGHNALAKDIELNSLKGMLDAQKNTTYLSDKISNEGDKTRDLISMLSNNDLNRTLTERAAALVALESDNRHERHRWHEARWDGHNAQLGSQFAQLQSMVQNLNSQIADTKQSMVNFGNMLGVGQSATSNTVR